MTSVHRVARRRSGWWLILITLVAVVATVLLWPRENTGLRLLVAKTDLPAGAQVSAQDFDSVQIVSGIESANYVSELQDAKMLTRSVFKGELLAGAAVADGSLDRRTPVVVVVSGELAHSMRIGSTVDVWSTSSPGLPAAIVLDATVLAIKQSNTLGKTQTSVELAVNSSYLEALMQAKANSSYIELLLQATLGDQ